jgi:hypothetical protein
VRRNTCHCEERHTEAVSRRAVTSIPRRWRRHRAQRGRHRSKSPLGGKRPCVVVDAGASPDMAVPEPTAGAPLAASRPSRAMGRGPVASCPDQTAPSGLVRERTHGLSMPAYLARAGVHRASVRSFLWPIGHGECPVTRLARQSAERMLESYGRPAFALPRRRVVLA